MADLTTQLAEAEAAYHALMLGQSVAELRDSNGELIRYTPANAGRLQAYIQSLKQQIGLLTTSGPARPIFL